MSSPNSRHFSPPCVPKLNLLDQDEALQTQIARRVRERALILGEAGYTRYVDPAERAPDVPDIDAVLEGLSLTKRVLLHNLLAEAEGLEESLGTVRDRLRAVNLSLSGGESKRAVPLHLCPLCHPKLVDTKLRVVQFYVRGYTHAEIATEAVISKDYVQESLETWCVMWERPNGLRPGLREMKKATMEHLIDHGCHQMQRAA